LNKFDNWFEKDTDDLAARDDRFEPLGAVHVRVGERRRL